MKTKLPSSIKTVEDAKKFLRELHENNEDYHCEDDACEIINGKTDVRLFTNEEGAQLNSLMADIYMLDGKGDHANPLFDPCGYLLFLQKEIKFENIMKVGDVYYNQLLVRKAVELTNRLFQVADASDQDRTFIDELCDKYGLLKTEAYEDSERVALGSEEFYNAIHYDQLFLFYKELYARVEEIEKNAASKGSKKV